MMKQRILLVLPDLEIGSATRQAALLTAHLPGDRFECRVASLTGRGPAEDAFGVPVTALDGRGSWDPASVWRLRATLADFQPQVVHAWQPATVRTLHLARIGMRPGPAVVVSQPIGQKGDGLTARLDAWLLQAVDRVVVDRVEDVERCCKRGLSRSKIRTVHPGMPTATHVGRPSEPSLLRFVACVGPITSHNNLKMAVWAFGVLDYLYNDLHLQLIGTGTEEARLRKFVRDVGVDHLVHFQDDRLNRAECFAAAAVVWVLDRHGGRDAILAAMAAGRPIIAVRTPETAELLGNHETGRLIPPDDPAELARQTRALLDDADACAQMGEKGRDRLKRDFSAADMVREHGRIYDEVTPDGAPVLTRAG